MNAILFWGTSADKPYLYQLKSCVSDTTTYLQLEKVDSITQVQVTCASKRINKVVSTSTLLLARLLDWKKRGMPSLDNYAGSYFTVPDKGKNLPRLEIVFIQPLKQLVTVPYGKFMAARIISKLVKSDTWYTPTEFNWELLTASNIEIVFERFKKSFLIAVDIETFKTNAVIRCVAYTAFYADNNKITSESKVLPLDSEFNLAWMRKLNWELKAPKVLQNGMYDIAYFFRYNAPLYNYLYDTANMFHTWYAELPKDLGFLNSFFIREATYWKDLGTTADLYEYYKYNALDTWGTGNAFLAMIQEIPDWAIQNYILEFPLVFPCHMAEMRGIHRNESKLKTIRSEIDELTKQKSDKLDRILGVHGFNVKSPIQMRAVLKLLGCTDLKSADEKSLRKAKIRHPFNAVIINMILDIRAARTLSEKYLHTKDSAAEFKRLDGTGNRLLYSLVPHGTDSSRLASKKHHFWCGLQIQNIPRGHLIKSTFEADADFYFCEVDLEQTESRATAYLSGDESLIDAVENSPDFHSKNASAFFGIPFNEIYDAETKTVLNKPIRQLAKSVNHGANYNMGPAVLVETMGLENITNARNLLGLSKYWTHKKIADYLLSRFHATYPGIKQTLYAGILHEIKLTHRLQHPIIGAPSWTRYCFGNPSKSKHILNSYIAHQPQSLNAQTLNLAFLSVFVNIAINTKYINHFKLLAQIHDSILFQYRRGHDYLIQMVKQQMEIPISLKSYDGKIRTFTVPASIKTTKDGKGAKYWGDLE